jgi:hypothetical protein
LEERVGLGEERWKSMSGGRTALHKGSEADKSLWGWMRKSEGLGGRVCVVVKDQDIGLGLGPGRPRREVTAARLAGLSPRLCLE